MNVNGITAYVSPYTSTNRKADKYGDGQFYQHMQGTTVDATESKQYASPQEIYEANKLTAYYKGKSMEEWSLTDPKYTDPATGLSWHVRDGKHPYMTGEDAEKFKKLCEESGEFYLKKFAEMTGTIQHLNDSTIAYVGDNGTAIKSKDGKELWIDTSSLSYDMIMNMFRNLSKTSNYFNSGYWYSFTAGDSMYIDKEKVQWAQYMNPLGAKFYTAEEMAKMQAELIEKNTAALHKLSDPYSILYKKLVDPNYNGERIFCEYPGGPLYTADEIMEVMNRNLKDAKYQAAARK